MSSTPTTHVDSIREQLTADHARLAALFRDVLRRLALDDRDETREAWSDFERGLLAHLDAEERLVLPAFAVDHPDEARAIRAEHDGFRARLLDLGVAVDLHHIRLEDATSFIRELTDHASRENALMYRWADKNLEAAVRTALIRGLLTRV